MPVVGRVGRPSVLPRSEELNGILIAAVTRPGCRPFLIPKWWGEHYVHQELMIQDRSSGWDPEAELGWYDLTDEGVALVQKNVAMKAEAQKLIMDARVPK